MSSHKNELIKRATEIAKADLLQSVMLFTEQEGFHNVYNKLKKIEEVRKMESYMPDSLIEYVRYEARRVVLFTEVTHTLDSHQVRQLKTGWGI